MQPTNQKNAVFQLKNITALMFLGALSACGGGGDNSSGTANAGSNAPTVAAPVTTPVVTPVANTLAFTRMGIDFSTKGVTEGVDLGATIDASANMTFVHQPSGTQDTGPGINFTFASGLPGGSVVASHLFSISNGAANKSIRILAPNATKMVQNVAWRNADDPTVVGFDLAGYPTDLTAVTWPATGTATYTGTAFQYTMESSNTPGVTSSSGRALYTSDVVATVDYAAQKITIAVSGNPVLIESSGTPSVVDPGKFASTLTYTGVSYYALNHTFNSPAMTSGLGLGGGSNMLRFFGPNAEEFGAIFQFGGYLNSNMAQQFIAVALRKQ
ncbi:hypothetical protein [Collimonas antrihumi]|uniref:hypothetical protein n=1 Tax=Collimonas antrihumi TaxID=1940615 RepID=UPI001B8C29CF|nr:hypothetical protein [Collimonas antrihumi]